MEFKNIKRTTSNKKKLMLWIDIDICESFENMGNDITVQEGMRQVLRHFVEGGFDTVEILKTPANSYSDELEGL